MAITKIIAMDLMRHVGITLKDSDTLQLAISTMVCNKLDVLPIIKSDGSFVGLMKSELMLTLHLSGINLQDCVSCHINLVDVTSITSDTIISFEDIPFETICVCDEGRLKGIIDHQVLMNYYKWNFHLLDKFQGKCKEFEGLIDNCYDSIYYVDRAGTVLMANPATTRLSGLTPSQVIGKNIRDIELEKSFYPSVIKLVMKNRKTTTILQTTKEGVLAVATGVPIFNQQDELERVVAISRDVNELVQQLENFSKTKDMVEIVKKLKTNETLVEKYYDELQQLRKAKKRELEITSINREMKAVIELLKRVAPIDSNILILGESGVGKDMIARRLIHDLSPRREGPFITINCGAISPGILESELFGYEAGAFTGALKNGKAGLIEAANGGTIFLNEIGELPLDLQVKLLQVIQDRSFNRVGGTEMISVDVRIISATNRDLKEMAAKGTFRQDLFYRLNVIPVMIPPLRQRKEDIPNLVIIFLDKFNNRYMMRKEITSETMMLLLSYDWPGNVRELENLIERVVVISKEATIYPYDLPAEFNHFIQEKQKNKDSFGEHLNLREAIELTEKQILKDAYEKYGSTTKVADVMGVNQSTIVRKLKKYNIRIGGMEVE